MGKKPYNLGHSTAETENADEWLTTRNKRKRTGVSLKVKHLGSSHPATKSSGAGRSVLSTLTPNVPLHTYKTRQTSLMDFFSIPNPKGVKPLLAGLLDGTTRSNIYPTLETGKSNKRAEHWEELMNSDKCLSPEEESFQEKGGGTAVIKKRVHDRNLVDCHTQGNLHSDMESLHTPFFLGEFQDDSRKHSEVVSVKVSSEHQGQLPASKKCEGSKPERSNLSLRNQSRVCSSWYSPLDNENSSEGLDASKTFVPDSTVLSECHLLEQRGSPLGHAVSQTDCDQRGISDSQVGEIELNSPYFSQDSDDTVNVEEHMSLSGFSDDLQTPAFLKDFSSSME